MNKQNLSSILQGKIYSIPEYQRGYAWQDKQLNDFVQDIDALIEEDVKSHYTGTIVTFQSRNIEFENYGTTDKLELADIVDGQQRLTTATLYLSIIIKKLISLGLKDFNAKIPIYLYCDSKSKLRLNNDVDDFFFDLISKGVTNSNANTIHKQRLYYAYNFLKSHIDKKEDSIIIDYLKELFHAITLKLIFTYYKIEEECEIGMTFELMNSRGKDLSILELLKNYLMHWVSRNALNNERESLTKKINKSWKEIYTNIANANGNGNEDQCLKIGWILYISNIPKDWNGYDGFKEPWAIPLRDFTERTKSETNTFIKEFTDGLSEISKHYSIVVNPQKENTSNDEYIWLQKIHNIGSIANFLPLIIACRIQVSKNIIKNEDYILLLESLEKYAYRVFLWERKRSNSGVSSLYRWARELFEDNFNIDEITKWIYGLIKWYSDEESYKVDVSKISNWYAVRNLLKYTLFEYELYLLSSEGKNSKSKLEWNDLSDSTLEHILPQKIETLSHWSSVWNKDDIDKCLHDIGNIVLTVNNSNYSNFDFIRKKGITGNGYCYSNSDIRQERKISAYDDWNIKSFEDRKQELSKWIISRWEIKETITNIDTDFVDDDQDN